MSEFTTGTAEFDAGAIGEEIDRDLEASIEGYEPARAGLAKWQRDAFARVMAKVGNQANVTKAAMFRRFGEAVANVPPILAAPATAQSTWTAIDDDGHVIEDGTEVRISVNGDESRVFVVVGDVTIAPGDEATAAGEVLLQALEAGAAGNELSADPTPISAKADFVESITLEGVTANGVDEEDEDAYLNRLVGELRLRSKSLVLGEDFEIDALGMAGVARAKCVEAYDADKGEAAPLHVSVWAIDAAGADLSTLNLEALEARQQAKVLDGITIHAAKPTRTKIKVKAKVAVKPGFDPTATIQAAAARLAEYLHPLVWPAPDFGDPDSIGGWVNRKVVRRFELVSATDAVGGVDYVGSLELAKEGSAYGTADVNLSGAVPLTEPGVIEVSAV